MADIANLSLPGSISLGGASGREAQKLQSYLYQLTEQLRYVLSNLDGDNMSATYNAGLAGQSVRLAELTEAQQQSFSQLKAQLVQTAASIAHDYESAIETANDRLQATVTEQYRADSENMQAGLESLVESRVTQTSSSLGVSIQEVSRLTQQTADALEALSSNSETWFRFTADGLEIGKSDDGAAKPYTLCIDNERLRFCRYGETVAYFQFNRLYVTAVEAADRVSIGGSAGEGFYDFITTATGLGIKWRAS